MEEGGGYEGVRVEVACCEGVGGKRGGEHGAQGGEFGVYGRRVRK